MRKKDHHIALTPEFLSALNRMETGTGPVFVTGRAGTGKSTLLRYFRRQTKKELAVVAPTGVAAVNVQGETIHSFFRLPPRPIGPGDVEEMRDKRLWQHLDAIIVDEISMVRADMMDGIDRFLRLNAKNSKLPFGGVRMILIGDLHQLPPVVASGEERAYLAANYRSPYFYSAAAFEDAVLDRVELTKVFRQEDDAFIEVLNAVRNAELQPHHLSALNARVQPRFEPPADGGYITLTTTNRRAREINERNLAGLKTRAAEYLCSTEGEMSTRACPAEEVLRLKEGAQVMFIRNDYDHRWINGTIGRVTKLDDECIQVAILDRGGDEEEVEVPRSTWEMLKYRYDPQKKCVETEVTGKFTQFPLIPAYAVTIHKSQGKTFDRVVIDLTGGTFAHGQAYVALSRCRSLDGMVLRRPFFPRDVRLDRDVLDFSRRRPAAVGRLF